MGRKSGGPEAGAPASVRERAVALYRRAAGESFTGEELRAFRQEIADRDLGRMRVLAPLMILLHVSHIWLYWVPDDVRATLAAGVVNWKNHVAWVHALTLPFAIAFTAIVYGFPTSLLARRILPFAATVYLCHGALATGVDQLAFANADAFTGYALGIAVICTFPLRTALGVYGIGLATVLLAIAHFQPDPSTRLSTMLNTNTVTVISLVLSVLLHAGRRRDFRQRRTIASQRDELANLNSDLERRVDEQVAEIVRRAEEVSHLNAQLRSQIRARSSELQAALARLAAKQEEEGGLGPGALLGDRFEIRSRLGAGGMGVVYSGKDRITDSRVAIKVIRPGEAIGVDAMRRFLGEASAVAAVTHPAVVRMIHVDVSDDGFLYQAQEFVEGRTLESQMEEGPWPQEEVARLGSVLCEALAAAHERGVVHRDVKPANVMLIAGEPGLKLLDFGLAKLFDDDSRENHHQTGSRLVVGTPAYMAPEQVMAGEVTPKADVYAVGVLMFHLVTGKLTFDVEGASRIMMKHVSASVPDVRSLRSDVRAELAMMIGSCFSKQAATRPAAKDLAVRLRGFADAHGAPTMEEIGFRATRDPAPPDPAGRTTASIARRMRGFGSVMAALLSSV